MANTLTDFTGTLVLVGAGKMGGAMLEGWLALGLDPAKVAILEPKPADEIEALHLACAFDLKVPEPRRTEVLALIALVNEQLWVGHFDMWVKDGVVMFRHALLLAGGVEVAGRQCEALLDAALDTSERYYQAFQFVVWAGKSAREALDAAMFETAGEA